MDVSERCRTPSMVASTFSRRPPVSRARPCTSRTPQAETPARNASAGVICSPGPPRWVGSSITSWWLRTWLRARPGIRLLEETTRLITRSSADIRASLQGGGALALDAGEEPLEVNHHALVRAACDQLDLVEGRDFEFDPAPIDGDHTRDHPTLHADRRGLEMLDGGAGATTGQHRPADILEAVGTVVGPDNVLEAPLPANADRPHRCHFTAKARPGGARRS